MSRIEVQPEALEALGGRIRRHDGEAQQVRGEAVGQGDVSTGVPELDASLAGFARVWSRRLGELGEAGQRLASNTVVAAANYRTTDRSVMPATHGDDSAGGGDGDGQLGGGSAIAY